MYNDIHYLDLFRLCIVKSYSQVFFKWSTCTLSFQIKLQHLFSLSLPLFSVLAWALLNNSSSTDTAASSWERLRKHIPAFHSSACKGIVVIGKWVCDYQRCQPFFTHYCTAADKWWEQKMLSWHKKKYWICRVVYQKSTSAALRIKQTVIQDYDEPRWTVDLVVSVGKKMNVLDVTAIELFFFFFTLSAE